MAVLRIYSPEYIDWMNIIFWQVVSWWEWMKKLKIVIVSNTDTYSSTVQEVRVIMMIWILVEQSGMCVDK